MLILFAVEEPGYLSMGCDATNHDGERCKCTLMYYDFESYKTFLRIRGNCRQCGHHAICHTK